MEGKDEKLTPSSSNPTKDKSELDKKNKTDRDGEDKVEIPSTTVVASTSQMSDEKKEQKSKVKDQQTGKQFNADSQKKCEGFGYVRESAPAFSFDDKRKNGVIDKPDKQASKNCVAGPSTASTAVTVERSKGNPSTKPTPTLSSSTAVQLIVNFYQLLRRFDRVHAKQRKARTCKSSLRSDQTFLRQEYILEELRRKLLQLSVTGLVPDSPLTSTSEDDDDDVHDAQVNEGEDEHLLLFSFDPPTGSTFNCSTFEMATTSAPPMASGNCTQLTGSAKQTGKEKNAENSSTSSIEKEKSGNDQSENEKSDDCKEEDAAGTKESFENQQKKN